MNGSDFILWAMFGGSVGFFVALPLVFIRSFFRIANTIVDIDD